MADTARTHGVPLRRLDLGGGLGIACLPEDEPLDVRDLAPAVVDRVHKACADAGIPMPRLAVEPGRAIAGPTTVTLYTVGTVKRRCGLRTWLSADGGLSDNLPCAPPSTARPARPSSPPGRRRGAPTRR